MDSIDRLVALALDEDLGSAGDVTTRALVAEGRPGVADFLAREALVLAGSDPAARVFRAVDPRIEIDFRRGEGEEVAAGEVLGTARGPLAGILAAERTALNFLQRLCGVATGARRAVQALGATRCRVLDTRKTTPGWRALEKAACRAGGATNHRFGLFDGILIKDNHLAAVGSVAEAVRRARAAAHHLLKVEVEVVDLAGVDEALAAGADAILCDNMDVGTLRRAVERVARRVPVEASGGVTLARLAEIAATGVDYVSMGALTHSARAADISLEVRPG